MYSLGFTISEGVGGAWRADTTTDQVGKTFTVQTRKRSKDAWASTDSITAEPDGFGILVEIANDDADDTLAPCDYRVLDGATAVLEGQIDFRADVVRVDKIIISDEPPTDTSALWLDTSN